MKLIIFGATGTIGRRLVAQALDQNHQVTAFARRPLALDIEHPNLILHAGDVLDADAVSSAVGGHDAVLVALGAGRQGTVRAVGTKHIVAAMQRHGVARLVCLSSLGVGDSRAVLNFFWKHIMFGLLLKDAYADHIEQENIIRNSGLDWTIARPAAFTDGPATGTYRHGFSPRQKNLKLKISRTDVANFMLGQLSSDAYLGQTPGLSY